MEHISIGNLKKAQAERINFAIRTDKILETILAPKKNYVRFKTYKTSKNHNKLKYLMQQSCGTQDLPDFLEEDGFYFAREFLRPKPALEILACQHALLRVLDVVRLLTLYEPFDPA